MHHLLKAVGLWLIGATPNISNFILVLVGIVMSLPKLAEGIEDNKSRRRKFAALCIVVGLCGLGVSEYQRAQADTQMRVLMGNTSQLVDKADKEIANTNSLVTSVGVVVPELSDLELQTAKIRTEIDASRGNPTKVAALQDQLAVLNRREQAAAEQLTVAVIPGVVQQLDAVLDDWNKALKKDEDDEKAEPIDPRFPYENRHRHQEYRGLNINPRYSDRIRPIMVSASNARLQLLQALPESARPADDPVILSIFQRASSKQPWVPDEIKEAENYLTDLASKVAITQTQTYPQNSK